jgi:outer membrane protein
MKSLVLSTFFVVFIGFYGIQAQNTKLAYLNADKVLQDMPEYAKADLELKKTTKEYTDYVEQLKADYTQKLSFLQQNKDSIAIFIYEQKVKELNAISQQISDFQQKAQADLLKKREDLLAPIKKTLFDAIEAVRKDKSYTDVINASTGLILASDGKNDIEADVRKKLGIK